MTLQTDNPDIRDPYNHARQWENSKKNIGKDLTPQNTKIIKQYLDDMEHGINVGGTTKGKRSKTRLLTIKTRMTTTAKLFTEHCGKDLIDLEERDVLTLFSKMRDGTIKSQWDKPYKRPGDYGIGLKAFWHWYQRRERKENNRTIPDVTIDLDVTHKKPSFVYLSEEDVRRLSDQAKNDYRVLIWLLFDSGMRTGGELHNVQKKDLTGYEEKGYYILSIKDDASKTFGRDIKLLLCSKMLHRFMKDMKPDDYLFTKSGVAVNNYLKRLAKRVFGDQPNKKTKANPYTQLTAYDFRHSSACYWVNRYKTETALLYRFGWKNSRMISYYTEFLGTKDTIQESDILGADEQEGIQKELAVSQEQNARLEEDMAALSERTQIQRDENEALKEKVETTLDFLHKLEPTIQILMKREKQRKQTA